MKIGYFEYDAVPITKTFVITTLLFTLFSLNSTYSKFLMHGNALTWKITYWAAPRKDAPVKAPRRVQGDEWRRAVAPCRLELIRDAE